MRQLNAGFRWNAARERAAVLVAEDDLSDVAIAQVVDVGRATLARWKAHPDFQARVADHLKRLEDEMLRLPIAKVRKRTERQNRDWQRAQDLIAARADEHAAVSGGATGLLVRQTKVIGTGQSQQTIEEYAFDRSVLAELRALEEAAAKALGQLIERSELTIDDAGLSDDERAARIAAILERARERRDRAALEAGRHQLDAPAGSADAGVRE